MLDLISIGDCVIDTFIPLLDAEVEERGDLEMIAMRYGDKIPVGPSVSMVAGNAANSAVGGARLGMNTAIYTNTGDDTDSEKIVKKFKEEGISTQYVVKNKDMVSNHHVVLNFKSERTILIYHQPWKFQLPDLERSKWVYLTSLSPSFVDSNLMDQLINYLERSGAKLVYNPGTFQIKTGIKKYPRLLSLTELFVVNVEEAKVILGIDPKKTVEIKNLLEKMHDLGPRKIVLTDGGDGSYGYDGENFCKLGIFKADLVEMTGSGDAFATATMAGLFHGLDLADAMRWGAANGASVVEKVGPQAGLLTSEQMKDRLAKNSKTVSKKLT